MRTSNKLKVAAKREQILFTSSVEHSNSHADEDFFWNGKVMKNGVQSAQNGQKTGADELKSKKNQLFSTFFEKK